VLNRVAFVRNGNLYTMAATGRGVRKLTSGGDSAAPDWSPDGRVLVFQRGDTIYRIPAVGGRATPLRRHGYDPAFSPDGRKLVFGSNGRLWISNANGRNAKALRTYACSPADSCIAIGPDWQPRR
jgi:Tol biopolymer transport system component